MRYWVNGTGNWGDTAHWDADSGGAGGDSVPTSADDVTIDALSGFGSGGTITLNTSNPNIKSLTCTSGHTFTMTDADTGKTLYIWGSATFEAGMTVLINTLSFQGTSTKNLTTAAVPMRNIIVTGGTLSLQDPLFGAGYSGITVSATFTTNGNDITLYNEVTQAYGQFYQDSGTSNLGDTVLICGSFQYNAGTINAGTSVIIPQAFTGGGQTYYEVDLTLISNDTVTISGANTFDTLKIATDGSVAIVEFETDNTINTLLELTGDSARFRLLVKSDTPSVPVTITCNGTITLTNVDFMDITGAGSGTWSGSSVGNGGGNTGITFTTPVSRYWVGNGGNYYDTAHWAASSNGAGGQTAPLCQDDVYFDAYSFSSGSQTVVCGEDTFLGKNINWTGVTNTPTWEISGENTEVSVFGSLTLIVGMIVDMGEGETTTNIAFYGQSAFTLTSAGHELGYVYVAVGIGSLTLLDDLTCFSFQLSSGTFDANDFDITSNGFYFTDGTLNMGDGTWTSISGGEDGWIAGAGDD